MNFLGRKFFWDESIFFGWKNSLGGKNFLGKKIFGSKQLFGLKNFLIEKILGWNFFWVE